MTPERHLWVRVVLLALRDATRERSRGGVGRGKRIVRRVSKECQEAHDWIADGSNKFRAVVTMAGAAPDTVRRRYLAGEIDPDWIRGIVDDKEEQAWQ